MARALVFAGNSFIGRWLCQGLRARGWSVTSTSRRSAAGTVPCDLLDSPSVQQVVAKEPPTWIFQCAGATKGNDFRQAYLLHINGTLNVLNAVRQHSPKTGVVLMGSAAEYGFTPAEDLPLTENHPTVPQSFFGSSKLAQTQAAKVAALEWGLRVIAVRPFNVIGPGLPEHYFAAAVAARLRRSIAERGAREFPITNAYATRDFVDVRDVVDALIALTESPASVAGECRIYNIATGIETPLLQMANELGRLAQGFIPVPGDDGPSRGGAIRSAGDSSLLRRLALWKPRISWRESLADMWNLGESGLKAA